MEYPQSPFEDNFNTKILIKSQNDSTDSQVEDNLKLKKLLKWLCTTPTMSSYRVNTITHTTESILNQIQHNINDKIKFSINVEICSYLPEVILVHGVDTNYLDTEIKSKEVIVDIHCAAAVLRGANVFAPGVMGMHTGVKIGDSVSIYVDLKNKCKKGYKETFDSKMKIFLGNGIAKMSRTDLFCENSSPSGVAVEVYSNISGCLTPPLDNLPPGSCLLQNLPSIICTRTLNPQPDETILDMCASPGNKTTHIAALMKNKGTIVAIDKTPSKVKQLQHTCSQFNAQVETYQADSTKIFSEKIEDNAILNGPPFGRECFDRILLDAPCSALGKRPQLYNNTPEKVLKSYIPLQRKLFENAVHLLKVKGYLVYSTCTITLSENEGLVAWALNTFKCLRLRKTEPYIGENGWRMNGLSNSDLEKVQRFGCCSEIDSIGFFIACFIKESSA